MEEEGIPLKKNGSKISQKWELRNGLPVLVKNTEVEKRTEETERNKSHIRAQKSQRKTL